MLPKKNRVSKKEIEEIFKNGRFINSPHLSFKFLIEKGSTGRQISFIAPKSVAKSAVKRNLLRRRGYKALEAHLGSFPSGIVGALIFKKYQDDIPILKNEIKSIFNKIN